MRIRLSLIKRLLAIPYSLVDHFMGRPSHITSRPCDTRGCKATLYGSFLIELQNEGLWPRLEAEKVWMNFEALGEKLDLVSRRITAFPDEVKDGETIKHDICLMICNLETDVDVVFTAIESPVLESHRINMDTLRK